MGPLVEEIVMNVDVAREDFESRAVPQVPILFFDVSNFLQLEVP
jgi:hypothetical protein